MKYVYAFLIGMYFAINAYSQLLNVEKEPLPGDISWLNKNIVPIKYINSSNDFEVDFKSIEKKILGADIIALGEVSHGSSEIYKLKSSIIKYLITNKGYNIIAIEAAMPEAHELNNYITYGKGDPKELIKGMHFWMWDTFEMLDLINWIKDYNNHNQKKIIFIGFDMQYYEGAIKEISDAFKKYNNKYIDDNLNILEQNLNNLVLQRKKERDSINTVASNDKKYIPYTLRDGGQYFEHEDTALKIFADKVIKDVKERKWIMQCYQIIKQYAATRNQYSRDKFMAENFKWIERNYTHSKIIIWAHNGHIQKSNFSMGSYIYDEYKNRYFTVAFAFHDGTYTAEGKNGIISYEAQASYPGTYEYYFQKTNQAAFLLDLHKYQTDNNDCQWLRNGLRFRYTGNGKMREEFRQWDILSSFDFLLFISHSTSSKLLHKW